MELSKILLGDSILPIFGVERSQLAKNTTQESGYSPTFLSKYHIGDVVIGKILENLGNGKGTFLISGTVLAGYMPEYLAPNDTLSFQINRSQDGALSLSLSNIPNSHSEKTRFSTVQIASLLGFSNEEDSVLSAIQTLKNAGQPISKESILVLLRLVEEIRSTTYLKNHSNNSLFATMESMLQEGVPLTPKNIALYAMSIGSLFETEQAMKELLQNAKTVETLPLRQSLVRWAASLVSTIQKKDPEQPETSKKLPLEAIKKGVLENVGKNLNLTETISHTFSELFSDSLSKSEEKIKTSELFKQFGLYLLSHPGVESTDVSEFLTSKNKLTLGSSSSTPMILNKDLKALHDLFIKYLSIPETNSIDLQLRNHEIKAIFPKLLLASTLPNGLELLDSFEPYIQDIEKKQNDVLKNRDQTVFTINQIKNVLKNTNLPSNTKMELVHSLLRSFVESNDIDEGSKNILISYLKKQIEPKDASMETFNQFKMSIDQVFKQFAQTENTSLILLQKQIENLLGKEYPNTVFNSLRKDVSTLFQNYNEQQIPTKQAPRALPMKENFQQSFKEVLTSASDVLIKLLFIPERNRTYDQSQSIKNISIVLSALGTYEVFNSVALQEHFPIYMLLPIILEQQQKKTITLRKLRIERHSTGEEKEMLQFGFSVPTVQLSEVLIRGSYFQKRITMQLHVHSNDVKQTIENNQEALIENLQEHGYSVVSLAITTKEQNHFLPLPNEMFKGDWIV